MKIALYNTEPKIENTAMMQVSQYHKSKGDSIEMYSPIYQGNYDKVYAFSLFNFTPKCFVTQDMIIGGTGFNIDSRLPEEIENCNYDYSLFPNCDTSYIWFSRGCVRNCPFCVVRRKEGIIHPVKIKNLNPKGEFISIMDNNFFANPKWRTAINQIQEWKQPVEFQSGIDVRLMNKEQGITLQKLKIHGQIHIAWDSPKDDLIPKIKELLQYVKPYKIMCYVLIGYWSTPEEDLMRVEKLRELKVDPFVMPFNKKDKYQNDFARWVNMKAIFKSVAWKDYKKKYTDGGGQLQLLSALSSVQAEPSLQEG